MSDGHVVPAASWNVAQLFQTARFTGGKKDLPEEADLY